MQIERLSAANRRELIRLERLAQRDMLTAYGLAIQRVRAELRQAQGLIAEAQGQRDPGRWIARQARLQDRLDAIEEELLAFSRYSAQRIEQLQAGHVQRALQDSYDLTRAALGQDIAGVGIEFRPPDYRIVLQLAGRAQDGSPLSDLLREAVGEAADRARTELIASAAQGVSPRETARNLTRATGLPRNRALLISRTESIGAYRTASLETYRANRDIVTGWTWMSTLDRRTCPVCWAMHGTTHTLDKTLDSHPGCRCTSVPKTKTWTELGYQGIEDTRPNIRTGLDLFDRLDPDAQRQILGPGKYSAYQQGDLSLTDLVGVTEHPRWGRGRRERALHELR